MGGLRRSTGQDFPVQLAVGRIWQNQAAQVLQEPKCTIAGIASCVRPYNCLAHHTSSGGMWE